MIEFKLRDAGDDLRQAFEQIVRARSREARLVFPQASTIDSALVDNLATLLAEAPNLVRVVLVHASAGMRFVASTLTEAIEMVLAGENFRDLPTLGN